MSGNITEWIKELIEWLRDAGILDALTDMITDVTVESVTAVFTLLLSAISSLAIGGVILVATIIAAVVIACMLTTCYVIRGIGLSRIAKKMGVKNRFLAWIPYGRAYLLGACAEQGAKRNGKKSWKWGLILLLTTLGLGIGQPIVQLAISIVLSIVPGLSALVNLLVECSSIILVAMIAHCLCNVCKEYMDNVPAFVLAVLGALGGRFVFAAVILIVGFLRLRPASAENAASNPAANASPKAVPTSIPATVETEQDEAAVIAADSAEV